MPSQSFKLNIPTPCSQSWDEMQPVNNGRHCLSCNKTVVDFSGMDDRQVQNYFIDLKGEGICGRFKQTQLDRIQIQIPSYIFSKPIASWKKYLVVLLVCFGSSILSVDVALGNTTGGSTSFIQGSPRQVIKSTKKTIKKKKKRKQHAEADIYRSDHIYVMGTMQSHTDRPFILFDFPYKMEDHSVKLQGLPPGPGDDKKETPRKEDNPAAAFIASPALYRRRKNKPGR